MDSTLYYVLGDHLGSTTLVADAQGNEVGRVLYDPYGQIAQSTLPDGLTEQLFTGQRLDSSTGLYYYNARYYDPHLGRFIQPDTLVPDPLNPQAWNRYAYVYGNPVNHTDPTGHFMESPFDLADLLVDAVDCLGGDELSCVASAYDVVAFAIPGLVASYGSQYYDDVYRGALHYDDAYQGAVWLGDVEDAGDAIRYAPPESGIPRDLQEAIAKGIRETDVDYGAFRGMTPGSEQRWAGRFPSKPGAKTLPGGKIVDAYGRDTGLRWVKQDGARTIVRTDLDPAWAIRSGQGISDPEFMDPLTGLGPAINRHYLGLGDPIVQHGTHIKGVLDPKIRAKGASAAYLTHPVYIFGPYGYVGTGPMRQTYQRYRLGW